MFLSSESAMQPTLKKKYFQICPQYERKVVVVIFLLRLEGKDCGVK